MYSFLQCFVFFSIRFFFGPEFLSKCKKEPEPYRVHDILGFHHDLPSTMNLVVVLHGVTLLLMLLECLLEVLLMLLQFLLLLLLLTGENVWVAGCCMLSMVTNSIIGHLLML